MLRESQRQTLRATSTTLWVEAHPIVTSRRIASEPKSLPSRAPAATPTTMRLAGSAAEAPPTELPVTLHEVLEIAPGGAQAAALARGARVDRPDGGVDLPHPHGQRVGRQGRGGGAARAR